jgi:cytochrome c oxidase subunit 3
LPLLLSFIMFCFFLYLSYMFQYQILFCVVFFFLLFLSMLYFLYYYTFTLNLFTIIQFFLNSQFFIYFVVSEVFFFFGIFWSLFWIMFSYESCFLLNLHNIFPFGLALFNTFLLLSSSTFAILFHVNVLNYISDYNLIICIVLGLFFLLNQIIEFNVCFFTISDFTFCSIFFFGTGFHGFHVLVGLIFLILITFRTNIIFFINCSLLYWHFVDVIWLFLFSFVYIVIFYLFL